MRLNAMISAVCLLTWVAGCVPGDRSSADADFKIENWILVYPVASKEWIDRHQPTLLIGDQTARLPVLINHGGFALHAKGRDIGDTFEDFGLSIRGQPCKLKLATGQRASFHFGTDGEARSQKGHTLRLITVVVVLPHGFSPEDQEKLKPQDPNQLFEKTHKIGLDSDRTSGQPAR